MIRNFFRRISENMVKQGEVEHVIWVGSLMISVNENVWQKSLHLFTKAEMEFLNWYDGFSLIMNFQCNGFGGG